jgi:hypothetical protein
MVGKKLSYYCVKRKVNDIIGLTMGILLYQEEHDPVKFVEKLQGVVQNMNNTSLIDCLENRLTHSLAW